MSPTRAPAKKRPRRGKRSLTLDATRSLPSCLGKTPRVGLLLLNCDGLFPDFEDLQGGVQYPSLLKMNRLVGASQRVKKAIHDLILVVIMPGR